MMTIPENWSTTSLEELTVHILGGDWGKSPDYADDLYTDVRCVRAVEVNGWQQTRGKTAALRKVKLPSLEKRRLIEGDLIIEISGGGPEQPVGRSILIDKIALKDENAPPLICTNFFRQVRPSEHIFSYYLNYFLSFFYQSGEILKFQSGSNNLRNLKFKEYLTISIPIPPLDEQKRIVIKIEEIFSELDKGVENLKKAQAQLKVYRQALLKYAFEGKLTADWREINKDKLESADDLLARIKTEREARFNYQINDWKKAVFEWEKNGKEGKKLTKPRKLKDVEPLDIDELNLYPKLPASWKSVKLGELVWSVKDGPHFSPKYSDEGVPFLSGRNIRPDGVNFNSAKFISEELHAELSRRCLPEKGDILYTKGGTTGIARVNTYDEIFNVWVHVAVLKITESLMPFYLQHALNAPTCFSQSQKYTHGVGNQDLGLTRMVNIILPLCSEAEQLEIIQKLDKMSSQLDQMETDIKMQLKKSEALRRSILKKAFSGELVEQDPNDEPASILLERIKAEKQAQAVPKKTRKKAS